MIPSSPDNEIIADAFMTADKIRDRIDRLNEAKNDLQREIYLCQDLLHAASFVSEIFEGHAIYVSDVEEEFEVRWLGCDIPHRVAEGKKVSEEYWLIDLYENSVLMHAIGTTKNDLALAIGKAWVSLRKNPYAET